jgi:hypothetical protein
MSCKLVYNEEGNFVKALTKDGKESNLFNQILKIPHIKTLEQASNLYANMFSKKMYSIIGEKGAQNLDNTEEVTFRIDNLRVAKEMEQANKTPLEIRIATGWEKGADGEWKYEIQTPKLIKPLAVGTFRLRDLIEDGSELFKSYPNIRTTLVIIEEGVGGISYGGTFKYGIMSDISVFYHELQHEIQHLEGFSKGYRPMSLSKAEQLEKDRQFRLKFLKKYGEEFDNLSDKMVFYNKYKDALEEGNMAFLALLVYYNNSQQYIDENLSENYFDTYEEDQKKYHNAVGEVEARNVETRLNMTPKERRQALLEDTEDVERENQIYLENTNRVSMKVVEPQLNFKSSKGNQFSTFRQALLDSSSNGDIDILFDQEVVGVISAKQDLTTEGGTINYLVANNMLAEDSIVQENKVYLKAAGNDLIKQFVNEQQLQQYLPLARVYSDGRIELRERVKPSQVRNVLKTMSPTTNETVDLRARLLEFLQDVGVTVTTIDKYLERHNIRKGYEASAEAIADIGRQVIAFKNGEASLEDLTEETMHFIVESWDEVEVDNLIRNIHKTNTYKQFYQKYREIYAKENPQLNEQELDNLVRREILAKELTQNVLDRFNPEGKEPNILRKLLDLFMNFFNTITLQGNYQAKLDSLTDKVQELLINKDAREYFELTKSKKFRMYSVPQTTAVKALIEQEKILVKMGKGSTREMKDLQKVIDAKLTKETVEKIASLARRQVAYVSAAVRESNRKKQPLAVEEQLTLNNLLNAIRPSLDGMIAHVKDLKGYERLRESMRKTLDDISQVSAEHQQSESEVLDRLIQRIIQRNPNLKEEDLRNELETVSKDTNYLYSYFGQISHAADPILNMLSVVASDIYQESTINANERINAALNSLGKDKDRVREIVGKDGYIISRWDFAEQSEFIRYVNASVYRDFVDEIVADLESNQNLDAIQRQSLEEHKKFQGLSVEEFLNKFEKIPVILNENIEARVSARVSDGVNDGSEQTLADSEVEKRKQTYAGLSAITVAKIRSFMEARAMVRRNMKKSPSGKSMYTLQNKHDLQYIKLERSKAMSIYQNDNPTQEKQGLILTDRQITPQSVFLKSENKYLSLASNASDEAIIAFEMQKLQAESDVKSRAGGVTQAFLDDVKAMEADDSFKREDIADFVRLNATLGFSDSYFDDNSIRREDFDTEQEYQQALQERKEAFEELEQVDEAFDTLNEYRIALKQRKGILQKYRDPNNSTNILAYNMNDVDFQEVKDLTTLIEARFKELMQLAKANDIEIEFENKIQKSPNESYYATLEDENLTTDEEKLNFTLKHMTDASRLSVQGFRLAVESGNITGKYQDLLSQYGTVLAYAESKMLPYYTSVAPTALTEFYSEMRNPQGAPISQLLDELNGEQDVKITVAYDYADTNTDVLLNQNKQADYKSKTIEPSLRKTPTVLGRTFDFRNKEWSKIENDPTLKRIQELVVEERVKNLTGYNADSYMNPYLLPQVERTGYDRVRDGLNKDTLKEFKERILTHRADEQDFGEDEALYEAGVRVIPKRYLMKLNPQEVTQDLLYSMIMETQQVELYKARVKYYGEVSALEDNLKARQALRGKSDNTYRMFKGAVDNFMFGVQETQQMRVKNVPIFGDVDVSKVIKMFYRFISNLTMSFNAIIPLTSMFTAFSTFVSEPFVKQYVDLDSYNKSILLLKRMFPEAGKNFYKMDNKSKLGVISARFGITNIAEKFENSTKSFFERELLTELAFGAHKAANFLPLSQVMVTALVSHRVHNNKVVTRKEFAGTDNEWKQLKSVFDYIEVEGNEMRYSQDFYKAIGQTEEQWKEGERALAVRIGKMVERVDGQIKPWDKTAAQRNFLLSWTMLHKGWMAIGAANSFKSKHTNYLTGQIEQGKLTGTVSFIRQLFSNVKLKDLKSFADAYKQVDDVAKVSFRRVLVEFGSLAAVTLIYLLAKSAADDDEEDYTKQLTAYLASRVKNETVSSQLGIVGELYKSMKEPIVGLSRIKTVLSMHKILDGTEIQRGRYQGLTERQRYFLQAIPGAKPFYDIYDADNLNSQRTSYEFFNKENDFFNIWTYILSQNEEDEE